MIKNFKLLWYYLKDEKLKLFIYLFLAFIGTLPSLSSAYFLGMALEGLFDKNFGNFILYLSIWSSMYIIFYCILQVPPVCRRDVCWSMETLRHSAIGTKNITV